jgi:hypothetical protein
VLGVREQPGVLATEALVRVLGRQQMLLVLDNCEHVIGTAAQLGAELLAACDDVRVLATSREPLRVAGEARYRLGPLPLPGGPDDASGSEAVALFADRAREVDARFTLDSQTGAAVAGLVTRLDGMPLAIELAAARVEALGVAQLLDRVDDRFALLAENVMLPGGEAPPSTPVQVISGGMAGWQITLIALGAALVAAAVAVHLDRTLAARRHAQRCAPRWPTQGIGTESGSSQDSDSAKQDLIDFG